MSNYFSILLTVKFLQLHTNFPPRMLPTVVSLVFSVKENALLTLNQAFSATLQLIFWARPLLGSGHPGASSLISAHVASSNTTQGSNQDNKKYLQMLPPTLRRAKLFTVESHCSVYHRDFKGLSFCAALFKIILD